MPLKVDLDLEAAAQRLEWQLAFEIFLVPSAHEIHYTSCMLLVILKNRCSNFIDLTLISFNMESPGRWTWMWKQRRSGLSGTTPSTPSSSPRRSRPSKTPPDARSSTPSSFFFFFITLEPRVERYKSLWSLNTSPPRNRLTPVD